MATSKNSLAKDLMIVLSPYNYHRYAQYLTPRDCLTPADFVKMPLSKYFTVDLSKAYINGKPNLMVMNEIFDEFSAEDKDDVKLHTLKLISQEMDIYGKVGTTFHLLLGLSMESWLNMMWQKTSFGDELILYALGRSYNRHTIIYNKNRLWCTMEIMTPLPPVEIHNSCDVHLIYIEGGLFATLRRRPETMLLPLVLSSSIFEEPLDMSISALPTTNLITEKEPEPAPVTMDRVHVEITVSASGKIKDIITNLDPDLDEPVPHTSWVITIEDPIELLDSDTEHTGQNPSAVDSGSIGVNMENVPTVTADISDPESPRITPITPVNVTSSNVDDTIGVNTPNINETPIPPDTQELIEVLSSAESDSTVIYEAPNKHRLA